jgi:S1 RNA binding domain protein
MQLEIGTIYQGTVKRITNYGAFVAIQPDAAAQETLTGMVHISEVSNRFVHDIHEFVQEGQAVRVKVIGIHDNKISLSMKQTEQQQAAPQGQQRQGRASQPYDRNNNNNGNNNGNGNAQQQRPQRRERPNVWQPKPKPPMSELSFEDMLSQFKQNSEERICDIKRNTERKNRTRRK